LRDSYFVIQALNRLGATRTMEAYLRYIDNIVIRSHGGELQPLYGIAGEARIEEHIAPNLPAIAAWVRSGSATRPTCRNNMTSTGP
jgi:GH15 family glucan-1,4-alpha-glucosidase